MAEQSCYQAPRLLRLLPLPRLPVLSGAPAMTGALRPHRCSVIVLEASSLYWALPIIGYQKGRAPRAQSLRLAHRHDPLRRCPATTMGKGTLQECIAKFNEKDTVSERVIPRFPKHEPSFPEWCRRLLTNSCSIDALTPNPVAVLFPLITPPSSTFSTTPPFMLQRFGDVSHLKPSSQKLPTENHRHDEHQHIICHLASRSTNTCNVLVQLGDNALLVGPAGVVATTRSPALWRNVCRDGR